MSATVVVCTRRRPERLRACLASVLVQPELAEVVVVENGPPDPATALAVATAGARHVFEPCLGSGPARNRGLRCAQTELVAFLDDDCQAEPDWLPALLAPFVEPDVHVVTGQILPEELATPEQRLFERLFPYSKGSVARCLGPGPAPYPFPVNVNQFGTGASMAFRRKTLLAQGGFVDALSAGGPARGGEDLYALYCVVRAGHRLVYQPAARARHPHPAGPADLDRVLFNYGVAHAAYLTHCLVAGHDPRAVLRALATIADYAARAVVGRRTDLPRHSLLHHLTGNCLGPALYGIARLQYG